VDEFPAAPIVQCYHMLLKTNMANLMFVLSALLIVLPFFVVILKCYLFIRTALLYKISTLFFFLDHFHNNFMM